MTGAAPQSRAGEAASALRLGALRLRVHHGPAALPPALPDREAVAAALDLALRDLLDAGDASYWVVRRLHLPFRVEPAPGSAHLVEAFARSLRAAMRRILVGEVVDGVRRYDSRAHWLAECLWAQACGTASGQWQFRRYRHHDPLPPGDAVRLTLAAERAAGLQALALIARAQRIRPFCDRLGEVAARGILRGLLPARGPAPGGPDDPLRRFLEEERAAAPRRRYAPALAATARCADTRPDRPLPGREALMSNLRRSQALAPLQPLRVRPPDGEEAPRRQAEAGAKAPHGSAEGGRGAETVTARPGLAQADAPWLETGFAGVFVLWRSVLEMDLLSLLPGGGDASPARLALAAALAGPDHEVAWADPALHWLCNHWPEEGERPPDPPSDLRRRFPVHYAERRFPRPVVPALSRAGRVSLLQDRDTEDWLWLGSARDCRSAASLLGAPPGAPPVAARDPAVDLEWFGVADRRARRGWALLARAAYGDFARRLYGLQGASAAWLWDKLLSGWGRLEPGSPAIITLPRVQLDLVLRMGGLGGTRIETPGGPVLLSLPGAE